MRLIPNEFKTNGYNYRLLRRTDAYAIYLQFNDKGVQMYELHKLRILEPRQHVIDGREVVLPKREALASNELWGSHGWTFYSVLECENKIRELEGSK